MCMPFAFITGFSTVRGGLTFTLNSLMTRATCQGLQWGVFETLGQKPMSIVPYTALTRYVSTLSEIAEIVWLVTTVTHGCGSLNSIRVDRLLISLIFPMLDLTSHRTTSLTNGQSSMNRRLSAVEGERRQEDPFR